MCLDGSAVLHGWLRSIGDIFVGKLDGNTRDCRLVILQIHVEEIVYCIEMEESSETTGMCEDGVSQQRNLSICRTAVNTPCYMESVDSLTV